MATATLPRVTDLHCPALALSRIPGFSLSLQLCYMISLSPPPKLHYRIAVTVVDQPFARYSKKLTYISEFTMRQFGVSSFYDFKLTVGHHVVTGKLSEPNTTYSDLNLLEMDVLQKNIL